LIRTLKNIKTVDPLSTVNAGIFTVYPILPSAGIIHLRFKELARFVALASQLALASTPRLASFVNYIVDKFALLCQVLAASTLVILPQKGFF